MAQQTTKKYLSEIAKITPLCYTQTSWNNLLSQYSSRACEDAVRQRPRLQRSDRCDTASMSLWLTAAVMSCILLHGGRCKLVHRRLDLDVDG